MLGLVWEQLLVNKNMRNTYFYNKQKLVFEH
jgi:hypothetical protein